MPMNDPLAIYLHDHLAGSKVAIDLLGAVRDQHAREPLGQFAAELLVEIEEDRAVLRQLGERVGAGRSSRVKEGIAGREGHAGEAAPPRRQRPRHPPDAGSLGAWHPRQTRPVAGFGGGCRGQ